MKVLQRPPILICALLLLGPSALTAQSDSGPDFALVAGASSEGDLTPGLAEASRLEPGWLAGVQVGYHDRSGFGSRASLLYARRDLDGGAAAYDFVVFDLAGIYRFDLLRPFTPYLTLGVGASLYAAVDDDPPIGGGELGEDPVGRLHVTGTVGLERAIAGRLGIMIEGGDRIVFPSVGESPPADGLPLAHNPFVLVGLRYGVGALPARRVAARPARPAPAAPPAAREPAPTEEAARPEARREAPPEARPETPPVETPAAEVPSLWTVQIEDFMAPTTAREWAELVRARGLPTWLLSSRIQGQELARLRAGATPSQIDASMLAVFLSQEYGWKVTVEATGPEEPVPGDAVAETREFLDALDR